MAEKNWRFIDTGVNDGFMNMALDEAILETHLQGRCPPTLRVYRWSPAAVSLGYFQDLETEIEAKRCCESGIDVVRRLTGGRAVFHDDELTYSVVTSEACGFPKSLAQSYRLLNEGLIAAYGMLGLEVCMETQEKWPSPTTCFSSACFSIAGLADLTFQGRKLCGSAQFRKDRALLQHGSLPITFDARAFFSLLRFPSDADREKSLAGFGQKAATLREISGEKAGWRELQDALLQGFQNALGITLYEDPLTPQEVALAEKLAGEKYKAYGWSYHGRYET